MASMDERPQHDEPTERIDRTGWPEPPEGRRYPTDEEIARWKAEGRYRPGMERLQMWVKGYSGNPQGRPRRKTLTQILIELGDEVTARVGDRALTRTEALALGLWNVLLDAAKRGKFRSAQVDILKLVADHISPKPRSMEDLDDTDDRPKLIRPPFALPTDQPVNGGEEHDAPDCD